VKFISLAGYAVLRRGVLVYDAVQCCGRIPVFQRSMMSPSVFRVKLP